MVKLLDTLPNTYMIKKRVFIIPAFAIILMGVLYLFNREEKQVGLPKRFTIMNEEDEEIETENSKKKGRIRMDAHKGSQNWIDSGRHQVSGAGGHEKHADP